MKEIYSNVDDCLYLKRKLKKVLGDKCIMSGYEIVDGEYHSFPYPMYETYQEYMQDQLKFYFKFCKNGFLRIDVEDHSFKASRGHKLAALSDFYEALLDEFGEPTVFYTLKDDENDGLHFQWSFTNKEETTNEFLHGFPFDDGEVDLAIVIGKTEELNEETRKLFSRQIGLPYELLPLINDNIEEYMKYKFGLGQFKLDETTLGGYHYQKVISNSNGVGR